MSSPVPSDVQTLDVLTAVLAGVAGLGTVVYVWLPRSDNLFRLRLFSELLLELAFVLLLIFAALDFEDETVDQRPRIKVAMMVTLVTAVYQIVAFGLVVVLSSKRGKDDVYVQQVNRRASKSSWVLFLTASFGLFVAYITISASSGQSSAADSLALGLVYPSFISVAVVCIHIVMAFVNCCRSGRRVFSWRDTSGYHSLAHKALTTLFAVCTLIFPIYLAVAGGVDTVSSETFSAKDSVLFMVDVLAAMLHRQNLNEFTTDRLEEENKLIKEDEEAAKLALSLPTSLKLGASPVNPGSSGAASSATDVSRGLPYGVTHQAQNTPCNPCPGSIDRSNDHSAASGPGTHSGATPGATSVVPQQHAACGGATQFAGGPGRDSNSEGAPSGAPGYAQDRQPWGQAPVGHGLPGVPRGSAPPPLAGAPGSPLLSPPSGAASSHSSPPPLGAPRLLQPSLAPGNAAVRGHEGITSPDQITGQAHGPGAPRAGSRGH